MKSRRAVWTVNALTTWVLLSCILIRSFAQQAQSPSLSVEKLANAQVRLTWAGPASGFILEETDALGTLTWTPVTDAPQAQGNNYVVTVQAAATKRFFRLHATGAGPVTTIVQTIPLDGESGVSVTRQAVYTFSAPLAANTVIGPADFFAQASGRQLLTRVELGADRQSAELFFLEPMPGSALVKVSLVGDNLKDANGIALDANGDGTPGGTNVLTFSTYSTTPIPQTAVIGHVYAAEQTTINGVLTNKPLPGVRVTVDGQEETLFTTTDTNGFFKLMPCPAGRFFVHVDGRTSPLSAYPTGDYYPFVGKAWDAIAGRDDNLSGGDGLVYLPLIHAGTLQAVSPTTATEITFPASVIAANPALDGVSIMVPANALFADNGTRGGKVGIAPVPPDRLPQALPQGLDMLLDITVQTDGPLNFDQPVPVRFPNLPDAKTGQKLPPGASASFWSFNHRTGQWEVKGTATVTADGNYIQTDPGFGVTQAGWHGIAPPSATGAGGAGGAPAGPSGGPDGGPDGGPSDSGGSGGPGDSGGPDGAGPDNGDNGNNDSANNNNNDSDGSDNGQTGDTGDDGSPGTDGSGDGADGGTGGNGGQTGGGGTGGSGGAPACGANIDCGCALTGAYVGPESLVLINANTKSADGRFTMSSSGSSPTTFTVTKVAGGSTVLSVQGDFAGFAPTGPGFAVYSHTANPGGTGSDFIAIFNMDHLGTGVATPVRTIPSLATSSALGWSPHGNYFAYFNLLSNTRFHFDVIEVATGHKANPTLDEVTFSTAFGGVAGDAGGWGFSPDCEDRTMMLALKSGPNQQTLLLLNLHAATAFQIAANETVSSGFNVFSPCGDVFGSVVVANGFNPQPDVRLFSTLDGHSLGSSTFNSPNVSLNTSAAEQQAVVDGNPVRVAANTANQTCPHTAILPASSSSSTTGATWQFQRLKRSFFYLVIDPVSGQVMARGKSGDTGLIFPTVILTPNRLYRNYIFDPLTHRVAFADYVAAANGEKFLFPNMVLRTDHSKDSDQDGLTDLAEFIIGTDPGNPDSDGDGLADGVEVSQGTNPLDGRAASIGVIANQATTGYAIDIATRNNLAAVAESQSGVSLFSIATPDAPLLLARVDTPGSAVGVVMDGNYIIAADSSAGVALIDISSPSRAFLASEISDGASVRAVAAAGGIAYAGTGLGAIMTIDPTTGQLLDDFKIAGATEIQDLAIDGDYLFALTTTRLYSLPLDEGALRVAGSIAAPAQVIGGNRLRLFVGGGKAYGTSGNGYNVFDVSDPENPIKLLNNVTTQAGWRQLVPTGSGLGVACAGAAPSDSGDHPVQLYDLGNDGLGVKFLSTIPTVGSANAVSLYRGLAFVADGPKGLSVVNFLSPDVNHKAPTITLSASFSLNPAQAEEGKLVAVFATVSDDVMVRNVEFYKDDVLLFSDGSFPFEASFYTPMLAAGSPSFTLKARAFDTGGNSTWSDTITVQLVKDATPPAVVRRFPEKGQIVSQAPYVSARFSEPILQSSLSAESFKLISAGPDKVLGTADDLPITTGAVTWQSAQNSARLEFTDALPSGLYQAVLTTAISDLAGNVLSAPVQWNFWVIGQVDSDGDGVPDAVELLMGTDPHNPSSFHDGILDGDRDPDGDGLPTRWEVMFGYDPQKRDSDGNGVNDGDEDADNDGLKNIDEFKNGTNPLVADTDGDGWDDLGEIAEGSDPLDRNSKPLLRITSLETSFLNAVPEKTPAQTPVQVTSAAASYLNAVATPTPSGTVLNAVSAPVSYLNALPTAASGPVTVPSPVVSYRNQ